MRKILIINVLVCITLLILLSTTYATSSSFLDAAQNALDQYKEAEANKNTNDMLNDYQDALNNKNQNDTTTSSPFLDAAEDANDKFEEGIKQEEDKLKDFADSLLNKPSSSQNSTNKNDSTNKKEEPKKEDTKKEESKKEETTKQEETKPEENVTSKEEINKDDDTTKQESGNDMSYISSETTGANISEKESNNIFKAEYFLYVLSGILGLVLAFIVYKVFIYSKEEK